jgi:tetratricopeptide (TPR) repeat protein
MEKAYELYARGARGGSDDAMHSAGVLGFDLGRYEESRDWLEKGTVAGNPRCAGVLGKNLYDLGRTEEAIEVLKGGTDQASLSSFLQLAIIYNEQGKTTNARELLLRAPAGDQVEPRERHLVKFVQQLLGALN